jgi:hypothetical protein
LGVLRFNGGRPGVSAWIEHLPEGVDWSVLFNTGHAQEEGNEEENPLQDTRKRFYDALKTITQWPSVDYFENH